ncbi:MAG: hypothetical protein U1F26_10875 [Lysobacterales bacterium]
MRKIRVTPTRPGQWEYRDGLLVDVSTGTPYEKQIVDGVLVDYVPPAIKPAAEGNEPKRVRSIKQEKVA